MNILWFKNAMQSSIRSDCRCRLANLANCKIVVGLLSI